MWQACVGMSWKTFVIHWFENIFPDDVTVAETLMVTRAFMEDYSRTHRTDNEIEPEAEADEDEAEGEDGVEDEDEAEGADGDEAEDESEYKDDDEDEHKE